MENMDQELGKTAFAAFDQETDPNHAPAAVLHDSSREHKTFENKLAQKVKITEWDKTGGQGEAAHSIHSKFSPEDLSESPNSIRNVNKLDKLEKPASGWENKLGQAEDSGEDSGNSLSPQSSLYDDDEAPPAPSFIRTMSRHQTTKHGRSEPEDHRSQPGGITSLYRNARQLRAKFFDNFGRCVMNRAWTQDIEGRLTTRTDRMITRTDSPPTPADNLTIAISELKFERRIGNGSFSTTYKASWERDVHGPMQDSSFARKTSVVAVKVATSKDDSVEQWQNEIAALTRLSHPNIVQYLGSVTSGETRALVLEFCEAGDLWTILRSPTPPGFTLHVSRGLAAALAYLHGMKLMHRDVKSPNVLMATPRPTHGDLGSGVLGGSGGPHASANISTKLLTPKLTDFGVSRETTQSQMTAETGTYRWMAPEVLRHEHYSASADVYSWALVAFECIAHEIPFKYLNGLQAAVKVALKDKRPELHPNTPQAFARLIQRCWSREVSDRPSASELVDQLDQLRSGRLTCEELQWLDEPNGHHVSRRHSPPVDAAGGGDGGGEYTVPTTPQQARVCPYAIQ